MVSLVSRRGAGGTGGKKAKETDPENLTFLKFGGGARGLLRSRVPGKRTPRIRIAAGSGGEPGFERIKRPNKMISKKK